MNTYLSCIKMIFFQYKFVFTHMMLLFLNKALAVLILDIYQKYKLDIDILFWVYCYLQGADYKDGPASQCGLRAPTSITVRGNLILIGEQNRIRRLSYSVASKLFHSLLCRVFVSSNELYIA